MKLDRMILDVLKYRLRSRNRRRRHAGYPGIRRETLERRCLLSADTTVSLVGGVLTVTDDDGGDSDDQLIISVLDNTFTIADEGGLLIDVSTITGSTGTDTDSVTIPAAGINSIVFASLGGDDAVTISFADDDFSVPIRYDGGETGETATGDRLTLIGGTFALATFEFNNVPGGDDHNGTVDITGNQTISFTGLEPVFSDITATDVTLNYSDIPEVISVSTAGGNRTTVASDGAEAITFNNPTGILQINAGDIGSNTIDVGSLTNLYPATIDINGGNAGDTVNLNGTIAFASDRSLFVDAATINAPQSNSDILTGGTGTVNLTAERNIQLGSGARLTTINGGITLKANEAGTASGNFIGIEASAATFQTTGTGNIQLTGAGGDDAFNRTLHGVSLNGTSVTSTATGPSAGAIHIDGSGGDGTWANYGTFLQGAGTNVSSVDGDIVITGLGGNGSQLSPAGNNGIVFEETAQVTTVHGNVWLDGTGNGAGDGNRGVVLGFTNGGRVASTGTGVNAGSITIIGQGANAGGSNFGVDMFDGGTVETIDGDVHITGRGGHGTGARNLGVRILDPGGTNGGGTVVSTGTGPNAGMITIEGVGGDGTLNNQGVLLAGNRAAVTSIDGAITIVGTGGIGTSSIGRTNNVGIVLDDNPKVRTTNGNIRLEGTGNGLGHWNGGVLLGLGRGGGSITSTGTGPNVGSITIVGTGSHLGDGSGSNGNDDNFGVDIGEDGTVQTVDGDVQITGQGGSGVGQTNVGVRLTDLHQVPGGYAFVTSTGTGPNAGTITIDGNGGAGTSNTVGTLISGSSTTVSSKDGDIVINGTGGVSTAMENHGVFMLRGARVESTGTGINAATITIGGTPDAGVSPAFGTRFTSASVVRSKDGDISIVGHGSADVIGSIGVELRTGTVIESTGTSEHAARITIEGTGGGSILGAPGIWLTNPDTRVSSAWGDIELNGVGGDGTGGGNSGVLMSMFATIESTGTGPDSATITINGIGGNGGTSSNYGVVLTGSSTSTTNTGSWSDVRSIDGDISISGQAGNSSGTRNIGVLLNDGHRLTSTGTGPDAAKILIDGRGGDGSSDNYGVHVGVFTTEISSVDGDISITGRGGNGTTFRNYGVELVSLKTIWSKGTGPDAANILIDGTGGDGTLLNYGVYLFGGSTDLTTADGDISIIGRGGNGSSGQNHGIYAIDIEGIGSLGTGSATISLNGTGGTGTSDNYGVYLRGINTNLLNERGNITITGLGGDGTGDANHGVNISRDASAHVANGTLAVNGTAVAGNSNGVLLSDGRLTSRDGSIQFTADGHETWPDFETTGATFLGDGTNVGIAATATGPITITADTVNLGATTNIQSTGPLTIRPRTLGTPVNLGTGATDSGLQLDDSELGLLVDGFSSITIGDVINRTGIVNIGETVFRDPVRIAGGTINDGAGTDILSVNGDVTTLIGDVAPGQSPGILTVSGNVFLANSDTLTIEAGGVTAGDGAGFHDQVSASGFVSIGGGVTLNLSSADDGTGADFVPEEGDSFTIISRTGGFGTFDGLPEGGTIFNVFGSGFNASISYIGGDGDDVVVRIPAPVTYDFVKIPDAAADGTVPVFRTDQYSPITGFGWLSTTAVEHFDTGAGTASDINRDYHFFRAGSRTFQVDVPDGGYEVTVDIGSSVHRFDRVGVFIEGIQVDTITTSPGSFVSRTYGVSVTDNLQVSLERQGGTIVGIGGLSVTTATPVPRVTTSFSALSYSAGAPAAVIDSDVTVSDSDSSHLTGATVSISSGLVATEDVLAFTDQNGITGSFNSSVGVLTLTGTASVADYQAALRSVTYRNSDPTPTLQDRVVTFEVSDGVYSGSGSREIQVVDPVTLSSVSFDFVKIADRTAAGHVTVLKDTVYSAGNGFGWTNTQAIETFDTGAPNTLERDYHFFRTGAKTFRVNVPNGVYEVSPVIGSTVHRYLQTLIINGTEVDVVSTLPGEFYRQTHQVLVSNGQIDVTIERRAGTHVSLNALSIAPFTGAPQVATSSGALTYSPNDPATAIDDGVTVDDFDSVNLTGATVSITAGFVNSEDVLGFIDQSGIVGTYDSNAGVLTLSGTAPVADYQAALRSVTYHNTNPAPTFGDRTVTMAVTDGSQTGSATREVQVIDPASLSEVTFDFVKKVSGAAADTVPVLRNATYDPSTGFGWLTTSPLESFDTGAGTASDLNRDYHFIRTGAKTFRANVANGQYDVTISIGSTVHRFDREALLLNGVEVDVITTSPGEFFTRTYAVTVNQGKLELTIERRGGTFVALNALTITPSSTSLAGSLSLIDKLFGDEQDISSQWESRS